LTFIGNLCATLLSIVPFFSICIYYNKINAFILAYVSFIFIIEFTREIIKDLEAMKGDVIFGYNTLPVAIGVKKTKLFLYLLMFLSLVPPFVVNWKLDNVPILVYFLISTLLILVSAFRLKDAASFKSYHAINTMYKVILLLGIGSIIFVR
jgi:4-hydroxybenzoate polyprenyltransferase